MYKFMIEKYTNEDKTKEQIIHMQIFDNPEEMDRERNLKRSMLDPDLIYLESISYTDERFKKLLIEYYDECGKIIRKEKPDRTWGKNHSIYSANGIGIKDILKKY